MAKKEVEAPKLEKVEKVQVAIPQVEAPEKDEMPAEQTVTYKKKVDSRDGQDSEDHPFWTN